MHHFIQDSNIETIICSTSTDLHESIVSNDKISLIETDNFLKSPEFFSNNSVSLTSESADVDNNNSHGIDSEDALVIYTSGTTGKPKGCVHTHDGLVHMMKSLQIAWEYNKTDKILHFLPLYHIHGLMNKLLCVLWSGGTIEFLPSPKAEHIWEKLHNEWINRQNDSNYKIVTIFMGVPTIYARMIESSSKMDSVILRNGLATIMQMRLNVCGSAALPDSVMDRWSSLTGHVLLERYGMTEIGMALTNPYRGR